jgi:acyl dehydratase
MFSFVVAMIGGILLLLTYAVATSFLFTVKQDKNSCVVKDLPSVPILFFNILKSQLFGRKKFTLQMPNIVLKYNAIAVDLDHFHSYMTVCGFSGSYSMPMTYPLVILFKLQALLLLDNRFPFPGLGLVHIGNTIESYGSLPLDKDDKLDAMVICNNLRIHRKGYCFDVVSEYRRSSADNSPLLWRSISTVLYICKHRLSDPVHATLLSFASRLDSASLQSAKIQSSTQVPLPENLGRSFAAISCDYNPIHLHKASAALFGFRRGHIVHGMWTCARALAVMMTSHPTALAAPPSDTTLQTPTLQSEFYVEFKTPVFLPGAIVIRVCEEDEDGRDKDKDNKAAASAINISCSTTYFQVVDSKDNSIPHVVGYLKYFSYN